MGFLLSILVILLGFTDNKTVYPEVVYTVYLAGEKIGMIEDKASFEAYIDNIADEIKEEYLVNHVYKPEALDIMRSLTYSPQIMSNEEIFEKIITPLTIEGYQITVRDEERTLRVNVNDLEIFEAAIHNLIASFAGGENYELYLEEEQLTIVDTGRRIDNIYLDNDITYRKSKIPVTETIYVSAEDLTQKLLFGTTQEHEVYTVEEGDTIATVAFDHEISVEEFLISNPEFTSKNNLLFVGQEVVIGITDPQVSVVVEEYVVEEVKKDFRREVRYDATQNVGYRRVSQEGVAGVERLTRNVRKVNGVVAYSDLLEREEIQPVINEVTIRGQREVSHVATTYGWTWPTSPGWIISSDYAYRINPFTRRRELHEAIDIAIGHGAHIYAANSGEIYHVGYNRSYGNYVVIKHNNAADNYTLYAHLARYIVNNGQTVQAGQLIGYMGSTGNSTGPHLHFELWVGEPYVGGYRINPWRVLR